MFFKRFGLLLFFTCSVTTGIAMSTHAIVIDALIRCEVLTLQRNAQEIIQCFSTIITQPDNDSFELAQCIINIDKASPLFINTALRSIKQILFVYCCASKYTQLHNTLSRFFETHDLSPIVFSYCVPNGKPPIFYLLTAKPLPIIAIDTLFKCSHVPIAHANETILHILAKNNAISEPYRMEESFDDYDPQTMSWFTGYITRIIPVFNIIIRHINNHSPTLYLDIIINSVDNDGITPLQYAHIFKNFVFMQWIISVKRSLIKELAIDYQLIKQAQQAECHVLAGMLIQELALRQSPNYLLLS